MRWGPCFVLSLTDTTRHLSEYVSLDVELGFINDHHDVMATVRSVLAGMVEAVANRAESARKLLELELPDVDPIPEIDFIDAQELIQGATGDAVVGEPDLAPTQERWLCDWAQREHGSEFLFVTGYPMAKRPFYTHPDPRRPQRSNSFDLLFRGIEIVTGGQRLHHYVDYEHALLARGDNPARYEPYLEAFRYGMPPHGGFAIGLERWVARLINAPNIRHATLFPRDRNRLTGPPVALGHSSRGAETGFGRRRGLGRGLGTRASAPTVQPCVLPTGPGPGTGTSDRPASNRA